MSNHQSTILVVEDSLEVAKIISVALRKTGAEINHCDNAQNALMFLDEKTPDLIILDIGMPIMNGWQFLEIIREDPRSQNIPVVVLTAYADSTNRMVGKIQAVSAYLTKPIDLVKLRSTVADLLR